MHHVRHIPRVCHLTHLPYTEYVAYLFKPPRRASQRFRSHGFCPWVKSLVLFQIAGMLLRTLVLIAVLFIGKCWSLSLLEYIFGPKLGSGFQEEIAKGFENSKAVSTHSDEKEKELKLVIYKDKYFLEEQNWRKMWGCNRHIFITELSSFIKFVEVGHYITFYSFIVLSNIFYKNF